MRRRLMAAQSETNIPSEHAMTTKYLRELMGDAHRVIEGKGISFAEAQRIAGCIAEIRRLLSEWADLESRFVPARPIADTVRVLKERSLELEGLVKEVRNSLERERRATGSNEDRIGKRCAQG
jgi:hypothetical protein